MEENQAPNRKGIAAFGLSAVGVIVLLGCLIFAILFILVLFGPVIGPWYQSTFTPCATVFLDQNGNGLYDRDAEPDIGRRTGFTLKMTDDSGNMLYDGQAGGCRFPLRDITVELTLTVPPGYAVNQPVQTLALSSVIDSYFPHTIFAVTQVSP